MKTKRKIARRRGLSFLLSVALLVSMLPLWGVQVAKALRNDEYPGDYSVKTDEDGNEYISLGGVIKTEYEGFIDGNGTFILPDKIGGKQVKEVSKVVGVAEGKKLYVPPSIDTFDTGGVLNTSGGSIKEIHIMCQGVLKGTPKNGVMCLFIEKSKKVASVTDVYFYPSDIAGTPTNMFNSLGSWGTSETMTTTVTLHLASQTVFDKFNADENAQKDMAAGKLIIKKDLDASNAGNTFIKVKRDSLASKISKVEAEEMAEGDYTKGTWSALQSALSAAKGITDASSETDLDAALVNLDVAVAKMVSLTPINEALAKTNALIKEDYKSGWDALEAAITAARAVPDNATDSEVKALARAVTDAYGKLQKKSTGRLEISWKSGDIGPNVPPLETVRNYIDKSGDGVQLWYYQDENCTIPAVGEDASVQPTAPGEYYVRGTCPADETYASCVSNVLKFTITRQITWDGYQWDADTGELTITEGMPDFSGVLEVPWYEDMNKITAVKVGEGVTLTKISAHAFEGAENLQAFQIPSTVKEVGESAFNGCKKLEATIALTDVTVGESAFRSCGKLQGSVSLADTMTEVPAYSFGWSGISSVTIPEGVTAICDSAFRVAEAIGSEGITLPSTVKTIGASSFAHAGPTSIALPEGLESIGESAFDYCRSLEGITLPASPKTIGKNAFASTGLKQIIIPATVQAIGGGLFDGCGSLQYVEILGTEYDTETLRHAQAGSADAMYDTMFNGTSPDLAVLCDGTTYDTLAGYAGTAVSSNGSIDGWPATVLHKPQEYLEGTLAEYQAEKAAASALDRADYTEAAWSSLQAAIAEADAMLVDGPGNYEIANSRLAARKKLEEGVMGCLQDILEQTRAYLAGDSIEKDYDPESDSWWALQDAMEDAGKMIEESTAGVEEIIGQITALKAAKTGLVPRNTDTVKAALDTAITAAKALAESDYTEESWKALQDAIAEAEALKAAGTISQIEAAQKKVEDAKNALVKKNSTGTQPTKDPNGGTGTKPTTDPNGGTGTKPTTNPNGGIGAKPTAKPQTPKVKKVTVKKVKSTKKKTIQVQWKKLSGVTGYQVQTALNKKFKKGKKTYTVKKAKTTKKTIKKLKRKKKYFVRVRGYKTVNGKKYYGSWSKAKSVKVK